MIYYTMHDINDVHFFNVKQILIGGNRNYISAPGGNISVPSMINFAQKHSQRLFCCMKTPSPYTKSRKGLKTNRCNFLGSICRIHGFNFIPKYHRHRKVSGYVLLPFEVMLYMVYLFLLFNKSQFFFLAIFKPFSRFLVGFALGNISGAKTISAALNPSQYWCNIYPAEFDILCAVKTYLHLIHCNTVLTYFAMNQ